jgi:hypothetical protein
MADFYSAASAVCFVLLGLWWVVVQLKFDEWRDDRAKQRMAYRISLYFLLPGLISMLSLLEVEGTFFWRSVFVTGAVVGVVETIASRGSGGRSPAAVAATLALYLLMGGVAVSPGVVLRLLPSLPPLAVEGILLTMLVLLGVNMAWSQLFVPPSAPRDR